MDAYHHDDSPSEPMQVVTESPDWRRERSGDDEHVVTLGGIIISISALFLVALVMLGGLSLSCFTSLISSTLDCSPSTFRPGTSIGGGWHSCICKMSHGSFQCRLCTGVSGNSVTSHCVGIWFAILSLGCCQSLLFWDHFATFTDPFNIAAALY